MNSPRLCLLRSNPLRATKAKTNRRRCNYPCDQKWINIISELATNKPSYYPCWGVHESRFQKIFHTSLYVVMTMIAARRSRRNPRRNASSPQWPVALFRKHPLFGILRSHAAACRIGRLALCRRRRLERTFNPPCADPADDRARRERRFRHRGLRIGYKAHPQQ